MLYDKIKEVNAELKGIDIKGKDYALVNDRVTAFRKIDLEDGFIRTNITKLEDGVCVVKAEVGYYTTDKEGYKESIVLATGHAYEKEGSSFINKTSYIENAETSAIGRALAMLGIGIETSIASYEEVSNARLNQDSQEVGKLVIELAKLDTELQKYGFDRHEESVIEYVNKQTKLNVDTLDPTKIAENPAQAKKVIEVYKTMLKQKKESDDSKEN